MEQPNMEETDIKQPSEAENAPAVAEQKPEKASPSGIQSGHVVLLGIVVLMFLAIGGYCWYLLGVYPEKVALGYAPKRVLGLQYAVWEPDVQHPQNSDLVSTATEKEWRSTKPGYVWTGGAAMEWKPGEVHPQNANLKAAAEPDTWDALPGYTWEGGATTRWNEGVESEEYPHWVTTAEEGRWQPMEGYKQEDPAAPMLSKLVWDSSWSNDSKRASATEGKWEHRHTCGKCKGRKTVRGTRNCGTCRGSGEILASTENCGTCAASGKVRSSSPCAGCGGKGNIQTHQQCSRCGGKGKHYCNNPRSFYDSGMHLMTCAQCRGNKRVYAKWNFVPCPSCGGQGIFTCRQCGGKGSWKCKKCTDGKIVTSSSPCPACEATGHPIVSCDSCGGTGQRRHFRDCADCKGGKVSYEEACGNCQGTGNVWK